MKSLSKKSGFRSATSVALSLALLLSLVAIPAFGADPAIPTTYVAGSLVAGSTGIASVVEATYPEGLVGTVTVETSCTPYVPAEILLQPLGNPTLGGSTVANDPAALTLRIAAQGVDGSVLTTDVVCQASDTFDAVLARVNSQVGAASSVPDDVKIFAGRKGDFNQPYFRLQKAGATPNPSYLQIWDTYTAGPLLKGVADLLVFGPASITEQRDTGPALPGNSGDGSRVQGNGANGTVEPFPANGWYFDPLLGSRFATATIEYGSWAEGVVGRANWRAQVDTMTGQYTGIRIIDTGSSVEPTISAYLATASRSASIGTGKLTFRLGNGERKPAANYGVTIAPNTGSPFKTGTVVAGKTETFTVTAPLPAVPADWAGLEDAYNGIRVLYPKEFTFSGTGNATASPAPASQSVVTSNTAYGPMVTVTGFVTAAGVVPPITVQSTLVATQTAGVYNTVKVWIRNVGTNGETWVPLFCPPNSPMSISVAPDVVSRVGMEAERNRAGGKTLLRAIAYDKFNNKIPNPVFPTPTISGTSDGAAIAAGPTSDQFIWTLAKTAGANTANVSYASVAGSLTVNTTGIGEPATIKVVPVDSDGKHWGTPKTTWLNAENPAFYLQLVDANGNPTSFLNDSAGFEDDLFSFRSVSVEGVDHSRNNIHIEHLWSRSSFTLSGPYSGIPGNFGFGSAFGPDTWTLLATANGGIVAPAPSSTITISAKDPAKVGVPAKLRVSAVATAPAEYAVNDYIYNDKSDDFDDSAFGYAKGDGTESVALTAQVVDAYGTPVTGSTVANVPLTFTLDKFAGANGILPTGYVYDTRTDASGVATVTVKAYRGTFKTEYVPDFGDSSWFTPIRASIAITSTTDWANPCSAATAWEGYGFTYFHGGQMSASLEQTPECEDKDVLLADGTDSAKFEACVKDPAFLTPVANWGVKFTTNFGSFDASGTKTVETTTGADGKASVTIKSSTANDAKTPKATLWAIDRQRTAVMKEVTFTDWKAVAQVLEPTKRAGDRAYAKVRVSYENFKTGAKLMWDKCDGAFSADSAHVYGPQLACQASGCHGPCLPDPCSDMAATCALHTNHTKWASKAETDTNGDGKYDSVDILIPAKDAEDDSHTLESAGKRYALVGGSVTGRMWNGTVFYNQKSIVAAYARPEVNFIKEATLNAEGTQFSTGMSVTGTKFTPGEGAPDYVDAVDIYLGDITTVDTMQLADSGPFHGQDPHLLGKAYVGRDGSLLPVVAASAKLAQMAPGSYDITVDGLVFKNGLTIKNMFGMASVVIGNAKRASGVYFVNPRMKYPVNVNAFGADKVEVWAGATKLAYSSSTGMFTLPASRIPAGLSYITAKAMWSNGYTTVVNVKVYRQSPLKFTTPSLAVSGRTLRVAGKVSGTPEINGSTAFLIRVSFQRNISGRWVTQSVKYVRASRGAYRAAATANAAGVWRAVVFHYDAAHPTSQKASNSKSVR